ncbi:DUF998 domain-containing protein [Entamoeba marina]
MSEWIYEFLPFFTYSGSVILLLSVSICLLIANHYGHFKNFLPFVSFCGYEKPEYFFYSIGFTITAILYGVVYYYLHLVFYPETEMFNTFEIWLMFSISMIQVIGMSIHSIVPIQPDVITCEHFTTTSLIHNIASALCFGGTILHTIILTVLTDYQKNLTVYFCWLSVYLRQYSIIAIIFALTLAVSLYHIIRHYVGPSSKKLTIKFLIYAQWFCAALFLCIYISHGLDLQQMLPIIGEKQALQQQN